MRTECRRSRARRFRGLPDDPFMPFQSPLPMSGGRGRRGQAFVDRAQAVLEHGCLFAGDARLQMDSWAPGATAASRKGTCTFSRPVSPVV